MTDRSKLPIYPNSQEQKDLVFYAINESGTVLNVNGKTKLAHIYGRKLDYPVICAQGTNESAEINWTQASKLARGVINEIRM